MFGMLKCITGKALPTAAGSSITISEDFPLGQAWRKIIMRLGITFTNSSGTSAIADGVSNYLKSATLRTERGDIRYRNMPGRGLMLRGSVLDKTAQIQSTVTVTGATVYAYIPFHFSNPLNQVPDATILDTFSTGKIYLDLSLGSVSDLISTPGDAAISAVTADFYISMAEGKWPVSQDVYQEVSCLPTALLSSATELKFEMTKGLYLTRLFFDTRNTATVNIPFSGTLSNAPFSDITLESDQKIYVPKAPWAIANADSNTLYNLPTALTGLYVHDFIRAGGFNEALPTGDKSLLHTTWTIGTNSTSQLTVIQEALRAFAKTA